MKFTKRLIKGKLIKRYKRFFVDIKVNKKLVTAHCPNTGSMMGLLTVNNDVWISKTDNPKRKLKYTLEIIKVKNNLVGVNTLLANKIVFNGILNNLINEFKNCTNIKPEVFFNNETRFDFLVNKDGQKKFIEIKNVTLFRKNKIAEFPDAITSRGSKHLKTLIEAIKNGYKTCVFFLVQIQNIEYFKIAKNIDKDYYQNYLLAKKAGVKFLAYRCKINSKEIKIEKKIKIINK
jgi:sugar fermentation stimulation protein A